MEMPDRVRVEASDGNTVEGRSLIGADGEESVVGHAVGVRLASRLPPRRSSSTMG